MKPWLERWRVYRGGILDDLGTPDRPDGETGIIAMETQQPDLVAAAPELLRELIEFEWVNNDDIMVCPRCGACETFVAYGDQCPAGIHHADCSADRLLKAMGLPDQPSRNIARAEIRELGAE